MDIFNKSQRTINLENQYHALLEQSVPNLPDIITTKAQMIDSRTQDLLKLVHDVSDNDYAEYNVLDGKNQTTRINEFKSSDKKLLQLTPINSAKVDGWKIIYSLLITKMHENINSIDISDDESFWKTKKIMDEDIAYATRGIIGSKYSKYPFEHVYLVDDYLCIGLQFTHMIEL